MTTRHALRPSWIFSASAVIMNRKITFGTDVKITFEAIAGHCVTNNLWSQICSMA